MKVAIVGSRDWEDVKSIHDYMDRLPFKVEIITGGARGVDSIVEQHARNMKMKLMVLSADWDKHGKSAGMIRNAEIVKQAEIVVAFWDGTSKGTKNTIDQALKASHIQQVIVFKPDYFKI